MRRIGLAVVLVLSLILKPLASEAQQTAMPVIGYLSQRSPTDSASIVAAFRQGLQEEGYVEGKNVAIESRFAEGQIDRVPALASDLVRRGVNVFVATGGTGSVVKAKPVIPRTIPIVFAMGGDPVKLGVVASLARPGDNITGVSFLLTELAAKEVELLHEMVDFDKLNSSSINLVISATNVRTGDIEIFDNRTTQITAEHIIASASLPPGFPLITIDDKSYWDGGLFNNTPLSPVIERLDPSPAIEKRLYIINLFPNAGTMPRNMLDVMDRMFELIFSNKLMKNVEMTRRVDEFVQALDEIEANLPTEARERVTKLPGYQRLRQYKAIKNLVIISNEEPELVFGPFDFSQQAIKKRIEAGYQAAAKSLVRREEPREPRGVGSDGDRAADRRKRRQKR